MEASELGEAVRLILMFEQCLARGIRSSGCVRAGSLGFYGGLFASMLQNVPAGCLFLSDEHVTEHFHFLLSPPD